MDIIVVGSHYNDHLRHKNLILMDATEFDIAADAYRYTFPSDSALTAASPDI